MSATAAGARFLCSRRKRWPIASAAPEILKTLRWSSSKNALSFGSRDAEDAAGCLRQAARGDGVIVLYREQHIGLALDKRERDGQVIAAILVGEIDDEARFSARLVVAFDSAASWS